MRILAIETSCSAAGVAVLNEKKLEAEIFLNHKLQHSVILFPMIENALSMLNIKIDDVDAIAVSGGPGSFTGLRIGLAAAKGIAQGKNKAFIAVSSLDAMAFNQVGFEGIICPIMDALRDNVYTALYRWENNELIKTGDYDGVHIDDLIKTLSGQGKVLFCGDGISLHEKHLREVMGANAFFAPLSTSMPRASAIAELALKRLIRGDVDSIYTYSPIYIRKSQAEREYERRHGCSVE